MRFFYLLAGIASVSGIAANSAAAADHAPVELKPSSNWILDYGEKRCRLGRIFGEGEEKSLFFVEQRGPQSHFAWLFASPLLKPIKRVQKASVQFGETNTAFPTDMQTRTYEGFGKAFAGRGPLEPPPYIDLSKEGELEDDAHSEFDPSSDRAFPTLDPEIGKTIDWVEISSRQTGPIKLLTGNLEKPFLALNNCIEALVEHWGLDVEVQSHLSRPAKWLNQLEVASKIAEEYPDEALQNGAQANFQMRVMIDKDGKAIDCFLDEITDAESFGANASVCQKILKFGKFQPALDAAGAPAPSFYQNIIKYMMP